MHDEHFVVRILHMSCCRLIQPVKWYVIWYMMWYLKKDMFCKEHILVRQPPNPLNSMPNSTTVIVILMSSMKNLTHPLNCKFYVDSKNGVIVRCCISGTCFNYSLHKLQVTKKSQQLNSMSSLYPILERFAACSMRCESHSQ